MKTTNNEYIVRTAKAPHPGTGDYRRIAVLKIRKGAPPSRIDARERKCLELVQTWEHLSYGKTARSQFGAAMLEAEALCEELNANVNI